MTSAINPTVPATGASLDSAPIRTNFATAKTEIEALQAALGSPIVPGGGNGQAQWNNASAFAGSSGLTLSLTKITAAAFQLGSDAPGDIYYNNATGTALARLGVGAAGTVLQVAAGLPSWATVGTASIANQAVSYAKIQNVTNARLLGNNAGASGSAQEISLGTGLSFAGTVLNGNVGNVTAGTLAANQLVYGNGTTGVASLGAGTTSDILHGNASGLPTWGPVDLSTAQASGNLPATRLSGVVPVANLGTGTPSSANFLRGDGSWQTVSAAPAGSANQVQYNSAGTAFGGAAGLTVNAAGTSITAMNMAIATAGTGDLYYRAASGALTPIAVGTNGQLLQVTAGLPQWATVGTGSGTVSGGGSAGNAVYYTGANIVSPSTAMTLSATTVSALNITLGSDATGDMYYRGAGGALTRIATLGTTTQLLHGGAAPTWAAVNLGTAEVSGTLTADKGGTGAATLTAFAVLVGNGTGAIANTGTGAAGNVLRSGGAAANPTWSTGLALSATAVTGMTLGLGTDAVGDLHYTGAGNVWTRLAAGATVGHVLTSQGSAAAPIWQAAPAGTPANPTATIGATAVNGSATTYMRSDAAPALGAFGPGAGTSAYPASITLDATGRVSAITAGSQPITSGASGQVAVYSGTNVVAGSSALTFASNAFSLVNAASNIVVQRNGTLPATPATATALRIVGADTEAPYDSVESFGGTSSGTALTITNTGARIFRAARNTAAAPAALGNLDLMGHISWRGYGSTTYGVGQALINGIALGAWTDAAQLTRMTFQTTTTGTTLTTQLTLDVGATIGAPTAQASPATGDLNAVRVMVNGTPLTTKYIVSFSFIGGTLANGQLLGFHRFTKAITFDANFPLTQGFTSYGGATAASTGNVNVLIERSTASPYTAFTTIGNANYNISAVPTLSTVGGTAYTFNAGDVMRVSGPATADATLANVYLALVGHE